MPAFPAAPKGAIRRVRIFKRAQAARFLGFIYVCFCIGISG